jgi:hypothetical protein
MFSYTFLLQKLKPNKMKKNIVTVLILVAFQVNAQTNWLDGQDSKFPSDPGRGVSNWMDHYQSANINISNVSSYLRDRMKTLRSGLARDTYSRLYADITYLMASYGLASAGWVNRSDAAAPPNDPNRALMNWSAHYDYVLKTAGYDNAAVLVFDRMNVLTKSLPKEQLARLYADCSILILNYSRMR